MSNKSSMYLRGKYRVDADQPLNKEALIKRGWTIAAIKKFLGEPDFLSGGNNRNVAHYYSLKKVEDVENSSEFKRWLKETTILRRNLSRSTERRSDKSRSTHKNRKDSQAEIEASIELKVAAEIRNLRIRLPHALDYASLCEMCNIDNKTRGYRSPSEVLAWVQGLVVAQIYPIALKVRDVGRQRTLVKQKAKTAIENQYGHIPFLFSEDEGESGD